MNEEQLVPSLDICKRIPADMFTGSFFAWGQLENGELGIARRQKIKQSANGIIICPAPTLSEILDLSEVAIQIVRWQKNEYFGRTVRMHHRPISCTNINPANVALNLFLRSINIETGDKP